MNPSDQRLFLAKRLFTKPAQSLFFNGLSLLIFFVISMNNVYAVTTYFVTNTANSGAGSLAQAITSANASVNSGGNDIISFTGFSGTIALTSNLPNITEGVTIDATTASGYSFVTYTPVVGLQGVTNAFVITSTGTGTIIKGLGIWHTSSDAIVINAANVKITNCWIGLTLAGNLPGAPAANKVNAHGININGANNCIIGGGANTRNVIAGCVGHGVFVQGGSTGTLISSNYIGLKPDGTTIVANSVHGVVLDNAPNTTVGGTTANDRNIISGNGNGSPTNGQGISIQNAANNCIIIGNYIGLDATGTVAKTNNLHGINIQNSTGTTIGGSATGSGNVISGNTLSGLNIVASSDNTVIKGNIIGLNAAGTAKIANMQHGMYINASNSCIIGGSTKAERNIISGNGSTGGNNGISIASCNNHKIKGNFIGTNAAGLAAIGNYDAGMSISTSTGDSIGGQTFMERNVCSGNGLSHGIYIYDVDNSRFYGNYLGTDSTGLAALPNTLHGVHGDGGCDNNYWIANVASGNNGGGLDLLSCTNSFFYGNFVGLGKDGTTKISNHGNGIRLGLGTTVASQGNIIGGTAAGQRNYVSGNDAASGLHGFSIDGGSINNTFKNNYIGCDITGMVAIGNSGAGIMFIDGSNSNTVGGTGANEGNILCCSKGDHGIRMNISNSNVVYGNLIGVNAALSPATGFGNNQCGVFMVAYSYLSGTASSNTIGSIGAGANIIANNGVDGVQVYNAGGTAANFDRIIGNKIYCNGALGINMETNAATENQGVPPPVVTSSTANTVSGTGTNGYTIHAYLNSTNNLPGCDCEGETYIGTTTVAGGTWSITHNLNLTAASALLVTATQTNGSNSTSEFWVCSSPAPLDFISFTAVRNADETASLYWQTNHEVNTKSFDIERSGPDMAFTSIGSIPSYNSAGVHSYSFHDKETLSGNTYYRLKQIDSDGKFTYSPIRLLSGQKNNQAIVSPNPNRGSFSVQALTSQTSYQVQLTNAVQQSVYYAERVSDEKGAIDIATDSLPAGLYFLTLENKQENIVIKMIIE